ncbi:glycogen/starch synthase [Desulfoferrobacter suflitae]|uniref:glycogen/starch synthase n=1 Tax=Desulfoferrobacter suflitae TaxID=2865782 RepID=UPI002164EEB2|nr:glycogen/starch synthase [Desulfoferrobacter suflitae]MCK8604032.1 glycogen/starch synthase [Desulfoferrobacter suflitae]
MLKAKDKLRVAMPAWEIGRAETGLGVKIGGLGVIIEELPLELVKAADRQGIQLEVTILSPCFAHYDKRKLIPVESKASATLLGNPFEFDVYEHVFGDGQKVVYFWDNLQLNWTNAQAVYPDDPQMGLLLYSSVSQAMASYIKQSHFDVIHLHDYHVGLIPFYLGDAYLSEVPVHFTIHNASYQGITPLIGGGYHSLERINLPGEKLFHRYFDFFDNLNLIKACMLKVHEMGGKITTVSGDIAGTWGYAAELKQNHAQLWAQAYAQKGGPPGEIFVPNRHLNVFEKLPIAGITNGLSDTNRPQNLPELKAGVLRAMQSNRTKPIFANPVTQSEMLAGDHNFGPASLATKAQLKRLLHLEAFGSEPQGDPILLTAVGRLVEQKNLGLVADIIDRTLDYDHQIKFIILASATLGDPVGKASEAAFATLALNHPTRVYFNNIFNQPLSRLILAGGDFCLIPSRFEPCGLVDYEASLLGNIVIGRATGGLTKVAHCAYLYEWLDISDRAGEAGAFFQQIKTAVDVYRHDPERHGQLVQAAMQIEAGWEVSALHYLQMYHYGFLIKKWRRKRAALVADFIESLNDDLDIFTQFFIPARDEYGDAFDWQLKKALTEAAVRQAHRRMPQVPRTVKKELVQERVTRAADGAAGSAASKEKKFDPRMHSAEHLVNQTMIRMFNCQRSFGAHIEKKKSKLDYHFNKPLSRDEIGALERKVNEIIQADVPVTEEFIPREEAEQQFDMHKLPADAGNRIRLVRIGDYDVCPCIGPHVKRSGEIGPLRIISVDFREGVLRIRYKLGQAGQAPE